MNDVFTITVLEQVKLLADPFRLRILELFKGAEPLTTKQVADILGEKPTKLYHHVEQLQKAGLINLVETRQNRGIVEKYYLAAAKTFVVDPHLFAGKESEESRGVLASVFSSVIEAATTQIRQSLASGLITPDANHQPVIVHLPIRGSAKQIEKMNRTLEKCIKQIQGDAEETGEKNFALLLAFYPVREAKPAGDEK
ncbi:MAG TPA: helix-turn-helix domain-containing protein [Pyrinomonadaceae bacterium]|jgi:DNA-binding transcriptional ArsR family regulator